MSKHKHLDRIGTEDYIRALLTEAIDAIEDELARAYLREPARKALETLKRFRDADPI